MTTLIVSRRSIVIGAFLALSLSATTLFAQKEKKQLTDDTSLPNAPAVLWQEPSDIASRDLFLGPGGEAMRPDLSHVVYIRDNTGGHTTKYRVRDGAGNEWVVKVGNEAQPETAASRLVWAAGYYTDITYFVPEVKIDGKGTLKNVRFEARPKTIKRYDLEWDWDNNPFKGSNELQGLKVLMVLLNNWDLKNANHRILFMKDDNQLRYVVSDLGVAFGKTGSSITHNRNRPDEYVKTRFVTGVQGDSISFGFHATHDQMLGNVTVTQAKWIGNILSQLSDKQISDAFRAADYSPAEIDMLTKSVRERIDELVKLPG
ncbi:MAG: hypothetical protein ABR607_06775 [Pyrinomonadaceae bacterium]